MRLILVKIQRSSKILYVVRIIVLICQLSRTSIPLLFKHQNIHFVRMYITISISELLFILYKYISKNTPQFCALRHFRLYFFFWTITNLLRFIHNRRENTIWNILKNMVASVKFWSRSKVDYMHMICLSPNETYHRIL